MNGKFIRQIGTSGIGPDEYQGIFSFCIDSDRKEIYLLDHWKTRLLKYRIEDGKLLDKIKLPRGISYSDIAYVEDNIYAVITHDNPDESNNLLFKIDVKTREIKEYISTEIPSSGWSNIKGRFIKDNIPKYRGSYTNTVFSCRKDSVYLYMSVKSKDWVRSGEIPLTDEDYRAFNEKGRAHDIHKYFENDTCIHFSYFKKGNTYHIVYNKQTQAIYRYQSTVNDINYRFDSTVYNLFSVNSQFAYDWMYSNTVLYFLKKEQFSSELAKQIELLNLDEEGFLILEYELK